MDRKDANDLLKKVRKIEIRTKALSHQIFAGEYHSARRKHPHLIALLVSFAESRIIEMKDICQNLKEKKIRFPYVATDFDGTLCEDNFPEIGKLREKCIEYVKRLAEEGSKIILYTCRENGTRKLLDEAVAFCQEWEIQHQNP